MAHVSQNKRLKKIPQGAVRLQFAGEIVLAKRPDISFAGLFARFSQLFEHLANMDRRERMIAYKMLNALILSSHARKASNLEEKRRLFDAKNVLFLDIANNKEFRKQLDFRYLVTKQVRVLHFCEACEAQGVASGAKRHTWKYCGDCRVDRNFFNVLSMEYQFNEGYFRIYLSHEHIDKIFDFRKPRLGKLNLVSEEAMFKKFHYNARNLDAFDLESALKMHTWLIGRN